MTMIPPLVFNVFKPRGPTSAEVVRIFKQHLPRSIKKIGHFGTLDPMAEGVLLIAIAGAGRLNDYIHQDLPKTYLLEGLLGVKTDAGDLMGDVKKEEDPRGLLSVKASLKGLGQKDLQEKLQHKFSGTYFQSPPFFSAAKHQGRPLYHWARKGVAIKKDPVMRHILEFTVISFDLSTLTLTLQVTASSGTYMRTLFEDCAQELETWGALKRLVRTQIGHITSRQGLPRDQWPDQIPSFDLIKHGLRVEDVLPLPHLVLPPDIAKRYHHGRPVTLPSPLPSHSHRFWIFDHQKRLLGMGEEKGGGRGQKLRPLFNWPRPIQIP